MSRSYGEVAIRDAVTSLISDDFEGTPFELASVEGTVSIAASITVELPDGWEFAGYHDSIEIERSVSF